MATLLYRLGKASFDNAWRVLIIWLVAFVAIGGGGIALGGATDEQFDIPGSPSQAAFDRLASVSPVSAPPAPKRSSSPPRAKDWTPPTTQRQSKSSRPP